MATCSGPSSSTTRPGPPASSRSWAWRPTWPRGAGWTALRGAAAATTSSSWRSNEQGYRNLLKLTSSAFLEGFYYKPRIDKELLRQHSEGLIGLSACLKGEINELIVGTKEREAEAAAREFLEIFGEGNFFLEMQDHGIPEQRLANGVVKRISQRTGIPLVASNDCHYLRKDDAFAHDVLLCIGTRKTFDDADRLRYFSDNFYLKSRRGDARALPRRPRRRSTTRSQIAERCNLVDPHRHVPPAGVPGARGLRRSRRATSRRWRARGWRSASPSCASGGGDGPAAP